ncbi:MAG: glycosyltransferase family 2 protein [Fluviicola sp.]|nr:glycosyltransferase family 2 protein [Fluviicola sp.]MBP6272042.1 glycosyltransferase family 2 protein [Fluviicola sp.]
MKQLVCVIPCRNEKNYIEECVRAIFSCNLPANFEINIIVVDGMSNDGTREVIKKLQIEFLHLFLVDNLQQLTPFAFNLGIKALPHADFIQIVGARHILSVDYLQQSLAILEDDKEVWCVGGKIVNNYTNETSELISKAMSTSFGMGLGNFRTLDKSGYTDTVTSPMYPKWVFEKIGYFDEELIRNQDDDFNFRLIKAGGKIYYCNEISLKYYVRGNFQQLWKQFFQYGYWKVYVNLKHKTVTTLRQLVPPMFVLFICLTIVLGLLINTILLFASLVYVLYFILAVYSVIQLTKKAKQLFIIPFIYPIIHISYGLGYLIGIFHFIFLKRKPSEKQKIMSR